MIHRLFIRRFGKSLGIKNKKTESAEQGNTAFLAPRSLITGNDLKSLSNSGSHSGRHEPRTDKSDSLFQAGGAEPSAAVVRMQDAEVKNSRPVFGELSGAAGISF